MKTILVLGATGQQGGATARQLLRNGWNVRVFTRNVFGTNSLLLKESGAELILGDMEDEKSLFLAMEGVYGVFSVQPPTWIPTLETDEKEANLGISVADIARNIGVKHLIYSSVLGSDLLDDIRPKFKHSIEKHIWEIGIPATILRPSGFMENYLLPQFGISEGRIYDPTNSDLPIALIAVEDIGYFAALAFQEPEFFLGKTLDLAGDFLTTPNIAKTIGDSIGQNISHFQVPLEVLKDKSEILWKLMKEVNETGYPEVNLEILRKIHPNLMTLKDWLEKGGGCEKIKNSIH
ncbi:NmrA/HSCARG family protein [Leptospira sp. 'Mane']|uniref:NmrA/HSCARG family protein n=1 Tax=Leptospira sp. 'Mane' TaxID=3387407 RepID=UPI00398A71F7